MKHPSTERNHSAFTLIELLVVIAIIAILAGLGFAGMSGAMESAKKAQARNDIHQLAAAVKAFQLEYGRLPSTTTGSDSSGGATVINALIGADTTLNPRAIVFFEPKTAKGTPPKGGLSGSTYLDPWGKAYTITLDTSYDNKVSNNFTTVIVSSSGGTNSSSKPISNVQ